MKIIYLSLRFPGVSRPRTLELILKSLPYQYQIISITGILGKGALINLFLILNRLLCLRISIGTSTRLTFFLAFQSSLLIIPVRILFPFCTINYDLGYPVADIPALGLVRRHVHSLGELFSVISADNISLESNCQVKRFQKEHPYARHKFYCMYVGMPNYDEIDSTQYISASEAWLFSRPYILFRGRLNTESGILSLLVSYQATIKRLEHYPALVIIGQGPLVSEVKEFLIREALLDDVSFITNPIDQCSLNSYLNSSMLLLGQLQVSCRRLRFTIPHKYFESMYFGKPYLSPETLPLSEFLEQNIPCFSVIASDPCSLETQFEYSDFISLLANQLGESLDCKIRIYEQIQSPAAFIKAVNAVNYSKLKGRL
jgi:glycosyltransferase involved in cell wall biosynthesis